MYDIVWNVGVMPNMKIMLFVVKQPRYPRRQAYKWYFSVSGMQFYKTKKPKYDLNLEQYIIYNEKGCR